jgi:sortase A
VTGTRVPRWRTRWALALYAALAAVGITIAILLSGASTSAHHTILNAVPPSPATTPPPLPGPLTSAAPPSGDHTDNTLRATADARRALAAWAAGDRTVTGPGGTIHAVLRIPVLGASWAQPVYDGSGALHIGALQLASGIGHFVDTEQPGQVGNYALAGHRSGVAAPALVNITRIRTGADIEVTVPYAANCTRVCTLIYSVTQATTVVPTDTAVLDQVPNMPSASPTRADLTLITCWPADGHSRRTVVVAQLASSHGGT